MKKGDTTTTNTKAKDENSPTHRVFDTTITEADHPMGLYKPPEAGERRPKKPPPQRQEARRRKEGRRRWGVRLKHHPGGADHNQKRHGWRYGSLGAARRSVRGTTDEGERSEYYSRATRHGVKITPTKYTPPPPKAKPEPEPAPKKRGRPKKVAGTTTPKPPEPTPAPKVVTLEETGSYTRNRDLTKSSYEVTKKAIYEEAKARGLTYDEGRAFVEAGLADLKTVIDEGEMRRRVWDSHFVKVVSSGRFKSQFEVGRSDGTFSPSRRSAAEQTGMGTPTGIDKEKRPIYGYLHHAATPGSVSGYGNISVVMKPEVKARTTLTYGDSLGAFYRGMKFATSAERPDMLALNGDGVRAMFSTWTRGAKAPNRSWLRDTYYIEAQYHGQVKLEDFAKVIVPRGTKLPATTLRKLEKFNIPVEYVSSGGDY